MNRIIRAADALGVRVPQNVRSKLAKLAAVLIAIAGLTIPSATSAVTLGHSSLALSDPRPSVTGVNYTFTVGFSGAAVQSTAIQCIKIVYATTATDTAGATGPTGLSAASTTTGGLASSTLTNSSSSGWSEATSGTTNNIVKFTNATNSTVPGTTTGATLVQNNTVNSSVADTAYYAFFNTYSDSTCSTPLDTATVEFINTQGSTLSLTIDNTLSFTVNPVTNSAGINHLSCTGTGSAYPDVDSTATTIPFGTVTTASNPRACQRLNAATNSTNGYTIYLKYDHKPQNALSQTISDVTGSNNAPAAFATTDAQGGYGYSTSDTTLSGSAGTGAGQANRFNTATLYAAATVNNAEVAYEPAGVSSTDYFVSHKVGITNTTFPGTYTNTIIYTCTPIY